MIVGKFPPKTKRVGNRVACGRGARGFGCRLFKVLKRVVIKHAESIVEKTLLNLSEKGKSLANFN